MTWALFETKWEINRYRHLHGVLFDSNFSNDAVKGSQLESRSTSLTLPRVADSSIFVKRVSI